MPIHEVAAEGFEQGAVDYERARPGYPQDAVDHLVDVLPVRSRSRVLDLAAGTGKFTRLLDSTGADIVAIINDTTRGSFGRAVPAAEIDFD